MVVFLSKTHFKSLDQSVMVDLVLNTPPAESSIATAHEPKIEKKVPTKHQITASSKTLNSEYLQSEDTLQKSTQQSLDAQSTEGQVAVTPEEIYYAELKYDLNKRKKYPSLAKKMGYTGSVKIKFELDRHGKVLKSEIVEASKYEILNQSVKDMLQNMGEFKPFPESMKHATLKFVLPVEFIL